MSKLTLAEFKEKLVISYNKDMAAEMLAVDNVNIEDEIDKFYAKQYAIYCDCDSDQEYLDRIRNSPTLMGGNDNEN